ncbi:MAG: ATP-dependent DNA helicase [Desulfotalea sp.]
MKDIFASGGALSSLIEHYQPREGQLEMAEAVADSIGEDIPLAYPDSDEPKVLVVEAETGIGKTLAYLLPAIISGKRVVVSTATRNLQDQILHKEIPLIEQVFERTVSAECVKGRQNYLCLYKWFQHISEQQLKLVGNSDNSKISDWLNITETGDRAELGWLDDNAAFWHKISSQSDQCLGSDCPEHSNCFITKLRQRAANAKILIVNHHLFFSDISLKKAGYGELLPRYEVVIFDEAHHLENIATTFFGKSFSQYQILNFIGDAERLAEQDLDNERHKEIRTKLEGLRQRLERFIFLVPKKRGRGALRDLLLEIGEDTWRERVENLARGIISCSEICSQNVTFSEGWQNLERRSAELHDNLLAIANMDNATTSNYVHWYERRDKSVSISATPISVSDELATLVYAGVECTVLTSATLRISDNFNYLQEHLGLPVNTKFLHFPSPFSYEEQALLYIPDTGFPEANARNYNQKFQEQVWDLLQYSRGRTLVLFTSFRAMESMAIWLEDRIDYTLLVQGRSSRKYLLETFKKDTDSVLLAVASFWEGIDVPGESLSCVIIEKLPFEVPTDPVIQARMEHIKEQGGNPFMEFQVPRAILALRQGVGRLMRSPKDRGVIAILDIRLFSKFYGKKFLKSLPAAPICRNLSDVETFFE